MAKSSTFFMIMSLIFMLGCTVKAAPTQELDPIAQAAAEATAIVLQAEATAIVLRARSEANAMLQDAGSPISTPTLTPLDAVTSFPSTEIGEDDDKGEQDDLETTGIAQPILPDLEGDSSSDKVNVISVGYAGDGGFIIVNYKAPVKVAQNYWPGRVSVTDETTGTVYSEVPTMPVVGLLIARPVEEGQVGYVMFVNNPPLASGSLVTVVLGLNVFEHITIQ